MAAVRPADPSRDRDALRRLWTAYLGWANDELEARHGFRMPVEETVEGDLAAVEKFQPPEGRLLLACADAEAVATASMQRIGAGTAEVKRMYVVPSHRGAGLGREMLDDLIAAARRGGYERIRLDSPRFMTAAHGLYRSAGFAEIAPYEESEIPPRYREHWVFMELPLASAPRPT
jgi:GNAT superfamily N-acetyltransferase